LDLLVHLRWLLEDGDHARGQTHAPLHSRLELDDPVDAMLLTDDLLLDKCLLFCSHAQMIIMVPPNTLPW